MKPLLLLSSLLMFLCSKAQVTKSFVDDVPFYGKCSLLYYKAPISVKDPQTVIFIPGSGMHKTFIREYVDYGAKKTNGDGTITYLPQNGEGPMPYIYAGWRPDFNIIVLIPSVYDNPYVIGNTVARVEKNSTQFINFMLQHFTDKVVDGVRVNKDKIHLTGLSAGARMIQYYVKNLPANTSYIKPQSLVVMSIESPANLTGQLGFKELPVWALCGDDDNDAAADDRDYLTGVTFFSSMKSFYNQMITAGWPNKRWTTYDGGHSGWQQFYNPYPASNPHPITKVAYQPNTLYTTQGSIYDFMTKSNTLYTVLPFSFQNFTVQHITTETILQWATANEANTSHFVIERSEDGVNFEEVGKITTLAPKGNSNSLLNYQFKIFNQ